MFWRGFLLKECCCVMSKGHCVMRVEFCVSDEGRVL